MLNRSDQLAQQLAQDPQMQALKQQFSAQLPTLHQQLQQHFSQQQWQALAYAAHSLKGSAGSMGYPEITQLAGELEISANARQAEQCAGQLQQIGDIIQQLTDSQRADRVINCNRPEIERRAEPRAGLQRAKCLLQSLQGLVRPVAQGLPTARRQLIDKFN